MFAKIRENSITVKCQIHRISWTLVSRETRGILVVIEHHRSKCATCAAIMHEKRSRENLSIVDDQFAAGNNVGVSCLSLIFIPAEFRTYEYEPLRPA